MRASSDAPAHGPAREASGEEVRAYAARVAALVEAELDRLVPAETSDDPASSVHAAVRWSLFAPAKRFRPFLLFAAGETFGARPENLLRAACAFEMVHTYSLVHDDLPAMDDDDLRRGRPTCHVRFGEDVAILAGDALYAEAFRHLLTEQQGEPARVLAAARELAGATGVDGMVGGQYLDVAGVADTPDELRTLHALKTGRLIGASVSCVLLVHGVDGAAESAYRRYAAELGVLFQIVDDILDVTGTADALGKPQGSDARHGKRTYVSHFGLDGARRLAGESHAATRAALRAAAPDGAPELEQITDFILTRTA
jgi:geranylgeranyl diphosphate synthase, type II